MTAPVFFDPNQLQALRAAANVAPLRPRVPLWAGVSMIGSVEPDFLSQIGLSPLYDMNSVLLKEEQFGCVGWRVLGDLTLGLNRVAVALREAGLSGAWRNEQLAVTDPHGHRLGTIERAAVRPLGITTRAVHLLGQAPDGRFWVQQRAFNKPNDPGLWDTLMGGMVSSADTLQTALARETWEEAGLHLAGLQALRYGGRIHTCRPAPDGGGAGYLDEHLDWYHCTVPDGVVPVNQDGEVAQFALMDGHALMQKMRQNEFTLEAMLIQAALLDSAHLAP